MTTEHDKKEPTLDDLVAEELARQLAAYEGTRVWHGGNIIVSPNKQEDDN